MYCEFILYLKKIYIDYLKFNNYYTTNTVSVLWTGPVKLIFNI